MSGIFEQAKAFFGQGLGQLVAAGLLMLWIIVPLTIAVRRFYRMDL